MNVTLTEKERLIILFELNGALETINESLATGDTSFLGEDEAILLIIAKLQESEEPQ
jgi:hypothetical protein